MKLLAAAAILSLLLTQCFAYELIQSRDEMLTYYYLQVEDKIPKSARMLIGDERINVHLGGQTIGIETMRGNLYSFETTPVPDPTLEITVSDTAAEKLSKGESGVLPLLETGEIKLEPKNLFTAIKMGMITRLYAASGADEKLTARKHPTENSAISQTLNSIYVHRVKIMNFLVFP